jgi:AraC-like DNA-binding protein
MCIQKENEFDDLSLLPMCILRDEYENGVRVGVVHVNDSVRPNARMLMKSVRDTVAEETVFTRYHFHQGVELLQIVEGEATVVISNTAYQVSAGDLLLINPYESHGIYLSSPDARFVRSCLIFDPRDIFPVKSAKGVFAMLKSIRFQNRLPRGEISRELFETVERIVETSRKSGGARAVDILSSLMDIYSVMIRAGCYSNTSNSDPYREEFVTRVSGYIESNLFSDLTTSSAASFCKYSDEHFCRIFKTTFGRTFRDYVTECKIAAAKEKIDAGGVTSVAALAEECGFGSNNHFTNMFRRYVGASPSEYMKGKIK